MDTDNERVRKDDPLRSLFQEVGHIPAPADMEARVYKQLARPVHSFTPEPPLIGMPGWFFILALLGSLIAAGVLWSVPASGPSFLPDLSGLLRLSDLARALNSRWTMAAIAGILSLMILDRMLLSRVRTFLAF